MDVSKVVVIGSIRFDSVVYGAGVLVANVGGPLLFSTVSSQFVPSRSPPDPANETP